MTPSSSRHPSVEAVEPFRRRKRSESADPGGRLGHLEAGHLRAAVDALTTGEKKDLVIDLAGVDYLSSAALRVLEAVAAEQADRGHQ